MLDNNDALSQEKSNYETTDRELQNGSTVSNDIEGDKVDLIISNEMQESNVSQVSISNNANLERHDNINNNQEHDNYEHDFKILGNENREMTDLEFEVEQNKENNESDIIAVVSETFGDLDNLKEDLTIHKNDDQINNLYNFTNVETANEETYEIKEDNNTDVTDQNEQKNDTSVIEKTSINLEKSVTDSAKDFVFGARSSYDYERFENTGIAGSLDALPRDRREAVYESFENAPYEIKNLVNKFSDRLVVENTDGNDCCHYNLEDKVIRMEECLENSEYSEVFTHEYGHFVDDQLGEISQSYLFINSINKDLQLYNLNSDVGKNNLSVLLNELTYSDAAFDRMISDNLSAYFVNNEQIIDFYNNNGFDYYCHGDNYWALNGNRSAEIYANCFSILAQNNVESCQFMEKYFPNTWKQFYNSL